jgi:hypothetical protein
LDKAVKGFVKKLPRSPGRFLNFLPVREEPHSVEVTNKPEDDVIDSAKVVSAIESGSIKNLVHAHILIEVNHRTKLNLNIRALQKYFNYYLRKIGGKNTYLRVKAYSDVIQNLEEYMEKSLKLKTYSIYNHLFEESTDEESYSYDDD